MKILLTGAAGQLGRELLPRLGALGEVVAVDMSSGSLDGIECRPLDLADAGQLEIFLNRTQPDLVVNAAAYTAVDRAEEDVAAAFEVNAEAPGRIARWAQRNDAALLHYSTDYVFDGQLRRPYRETDTPAPLNSYGDSKYAGERAIQASGCRHVILRSSWIYSGHGKNFVLTMLELARRNIALRVVGDQVGCPTWARNLARYSVKTMEHVLLSDDHHQGGLYHCCDRDDCSWYDFAFLVFRIATQLGLLERMPELEQVTSEQFPQPARRPRWSVMSTRTIEEEIGVRPAGLENSLRRCLEEISFS